jgi:tRNA(fMet)-specific endonuclease VapC
MPTGIRISSAVTLRILESADVVCIPFVVVAELLAGFAAGSRGDDNRKFFDLFLGRSGVEVLYPDEQTNHYYAQIFVQLRQQGTPIPTNDIWIAAITLQHGLTLCSRDAHFDHLRQLARI